MQAKIIGSDNMSEPIIATCFSSSEEQELKEELNDILNFSQKGIDVKGIFEFDDYTALNSNIEKRLIPKIYIGKSQEDVLSYIKTKKLLIDRIEETNNLLKNFENNLNEALKKINEENMQQLVEIDNYFLQKNDKEMEILNERIREKNISYSNLTESKNKDKELKLQKLNEQFDNFKNDIVKSFEEREDIQLYKNVLEQCIQYKDNIIQRFDFEYDWEEFSLEEKDFVIDIFYELCSDVNDSDIESFLDFKEGKFAEKLDDIKTNIVFSLVFFILSYLTFLNNYDFKDIVKYLISSIIVLPLSRFIYVVFTKINKLINIKKVMPKIRFICLYANEILKNIEKENINNKIKDAEKKYNENKIKIEQECDNYLNSFSEELVKFNRFVDEEKNKIEKIIEEEKEKKISKNREILLAKQNQKKEDMNIENQRLQEKLKVFQENLDNMKDLKLEPHKSLLLNTTLLVGIENYKGNQIEKIKKFRQGSYLIIHKKENSFNCIEFIKTLIMQIVYTTESLKEYVSILDLENFGEMFNDFLFDDNYFKLIKSKLDLEQFMLNINLQIENNIKLFKDKSIDEYNIEALFKNSKEEKYNIIFIPYFNEELMKNEKFLSLIKRGKQGFTTICNYVYDESDEESRKELEEIYEKFDFVGSYEQEIICLSNEFSIEILDF